MKLLIKRLLYIFITLHVIPVQAAVLQLTNQYNLQSFENGLGTGWANVDGRTPFSIVSSGCYHGTKCLKATARNQVSWDVNATVPGRLQFKYKTQQTDGGPTGISFIAVHCGGGPTCSTTGPISVTIVYNESVGWSTFYVDIPPGRYGFGLYFNDWENDPAAAVWIDYAEFIPDLDRDNDSLDFTIDNCPDDANFNQLDYDNDGAGDVCDADKDNDGVFDNSSANPLDACPLDAAETVDSDSDGTCDNADLSDDGDAVNDTIDNCPLIANNNQLNTDGDAQGDVCDTDDDGDGVVDASDVFPLDSTETVDTDNDGTGNNADSDDDGDGVADITDDFPLFLEAATDTDGDGFPDTLVGSYASPEDFESGGFASHSWVMGGDAAWIITNSTKHAGVFSARSGLINDSETSSLQITANTTAIVSFWFRTSTEDGWDYLEFYIDGVLVDSWSGTNDWQQYSKDITPDSHTLIWKYTKDTILSDGLDTVWIDDINFGTSFIEDDDDDNDGVLDINDALPIDATESIDTDNDGMGDNADTDDDGDAVDDVSDNCSLASNASQTDADSDDVGDVCDAFPNDATESVDTDNDGVGDNSDNCLNTANDQTDTDSNGFGDACDNYTKNGTKSGDNFGAALALGDMNNDGYADMVIGAPLKDVSGKKDAGQIQIISGADGSILKTFNGKKDGERFGSAIAVVEDQNSDGVPDLIVGSPLYDVSDTKKDAGKVSLYSGANGVLLQTIVKGSKANDQLGASVAVGDVDNDGNVNLIIGTPRADVSGLQDAGRITVYTGINSTILYTRSGTQAGEYFGAAVAMDAVQYLLVGSPSYDVTTLGSNEGRVTIFDGTDITGLSAALFTLDGTTLQDNFGASVAVFEEDLDGDSNIDWAAGSPKADSSGVDAGKVEIFSGINTTPIATIDGATAGDNFGASVSTGDVNGDGVNDIAIGSPKFDAPASDAGRVEVMSGTMF